MHTQLPWSSEEALPTCYRSTPYDRLHRERQCPLQQRGALPAPTTEKLIQSITVALCPQSIYSQFKRNCLRSLFLPCFHRLHLRTAAQQSSRRGQMARLPQLQQAWRSAASESARFETWLMTSSLQKLLVVNDATCKID